jgi:hypothetical protein
LGFHCVDDLPEALITGREAIYSDWFFNRKSANPHRIDAAARHEYLRVFQQPGALRAGFLPGLCAVGRAESPACAKR